MPYATKWIPNEVAVTHNGVSIYHLYKHDDIDSGRYWFHYTTQIHGGEDEQVGPFDIRTLPPIDGLDPHDREQHPALLRAHIERGTISPPPSDEPTAEDALIETIAPQPSPDAYRAVAVERFGPESGEEDTRVYEDAPVEPVDGGEGAWVQAWVWVYAEEAQGQ